MRTIFIIIFIVGLSCLAWKWNSIIGLLSMSKHQQHATTEQEDKLGTNTTENNQKILIAYFSWGGNTRKLAYEIHSKIGGDIFEIKTKDQNRYPDDYKSATEVARKEFAANIKPELEKNLNNINEYDIILIGFPIWWHTAPMAIQVFLESHDFSNKTIIPFATSGGDDIEPSIPKLKRLAPNANFGEAITANSRIWVNSWLKKNGLTINN